MLDAIDDGGYRMVQFTVYVAVGGSESIFGVIRQAWLLVCEWL